MAGHVHGSVVAVDDLGAELHELVDHLVDLMLVARNQGAGEDHGVELVDVDVTVVAVGDTAEGGHRLTLGAGAHVDELVILDIVGLLEVHDGAFGDVQVAEVGGDGHVAHHGAADEHDLAAVFVGGVHHLLHTVHMGGEAGDDDLAGGLRERLVKGRADGGLGLDEAGHLGVGGIHHQQVHALFADLAEFDKVSDAVVKRQLVELDVARVDQRAGRSLDVDGQGVRDGVGDVDEFKVERAHLELVAAGDLHLGGVLVVFLALGVHEREGQLGADQRDVRAQLEQVGHAADVVLVAVGQHEGVHLVETVLDVAEIRQDEIHARLLLLGEEHAAVDEQQVTVVFDHVHVAADFAQAAERRDAHGALAVLRRGDQHGVLLGRGGLLVGVDLTGRGAAVGAVAPGAAGRAAAARTGVLGVLGCLCFLLFCCHNFLIDFCCVASALSCRSGGLATRVQQLYGFALQQSGGAHALFGLVELGGIGADVGQTHRGGGDDALDLERGLGHDGLVAVAVKRVDERGELVGKTTGGGDVAAVKRLDKLLHGVGCDVGDHRDDADGADGEERQEQAVIAGIPGETGALLFLHCGCKVAGGVLDSLDVFEFGQTVVGFDLDLQTGAAGDIVDDDRLFGGFVDGLVVADDTVLGGAGIVGHDDEHRVGARFLGLFDHAHGVGGVVGAGARNHRDVHDFLDRPDEVDLLIHVGDGRFSGGAVDHQTVRAIGDELFGELLRGFEVDAAVGFHGGYHGRKNAAKRRGIKKMHVMLVHSAYRTSHCGLLYYIFS